MKSLYLRIWLTVIAVLLLFALIAGWLFQSNVEHERERVQSMWADRAAAWAALIENSLPERDAPVTEQRAAVLDWSQRLRLPLALDDAAGRRIATSESFERREAQGPAAPRRAVRLPLSDGRTLWIMRPGMGGLRGGGPRGEGDAPRPGPGGGFGPDRGAERGPERGPGWSFGAGLGGGPGSGFLTLPRGLMLPGAWGGGVGLVVTLAVLFFAIALGAYPVVRRLTRRLEGLQRGVESFGAGQLSQRVNDDGRDEVAALARSFNAAAQRIEALVLSHRNLLANASHELRSPLARMKMAFAMLDSADAPARAKLRQEIERNIRELDELVEEVLLASRLDARVEAASAPHTAVALLPLAAEEGARFNAQVTGDDVMVQGDERLLRRALRNLLENARRYGGAAPPEVNIRRQDGAVDSRGGTPSGAPAGAGGAAQRSASVELRVGDRGPGVPESERERIFEPFYRLPGHAEHAGGVGLGLSLVRQIAGAHRGTVRCEAREGGGSWFVLTLPA
jgi:signal transduction histidine kinase